MKNLACFFKTFIISIILFISAADTVANDKLVVTPQMFGAIVGDDIDDVDAITKANDYLYANGGGVLLFTGGIYTIGKFPIYESNVGYGAIRVHSDICYRGELGSIIKVKDNVNNRTFAWQGVFYESYIENTCNVCFENLTFDLNGFNNYYPEADSNDNGACCAAIRMLYPKKVKIIGCKIFNCPGLNCLPLGFADGALIEGCQFVNSADAISGNKIHDHSCILIAGDSITIRDNYFFNRSKSRVSTAIEINSSNSRIVNNYVCNFKVACLLSPTPPSSVENVLISGNYFNDNQISFQVWHGDSLSNVSDILFTKNYIRTFSHTSLGGFAIDLFNYVKYPISNIFIDNNKIESTSVNQNGYYGGIIVGGNANNVAISNNQITGLTGSAIYLIDGVNNISMAKNIISDCCSSNHTEANRFLLINGGKRISRNIHIENNVFKSRRKAIRGIWIINECQGLKVNNNMFYGFEEYNKIDSQLLFGNDIIIK